MRLIDKDKLLHQGYDYVVDGIAYDSCNKSMDIEDIPTVQAIPLAKIKQARAEIISESFPEGDDSFSKMLYLIDVLSILDKLIESEE